MIFNMIGGGGDVALNFKIVAYSTKDNLLAATPSENTIGVVTTTAISSYIFSPSQPYVPTPGMLWIAVGTSSNITFNAIKKNAITLCPLFARQYISDAWVDVDALSYIGGAWLEWTKDIILYDNGAIDGVTLDMTNAKDSGEYLTLTLGKNSSATVKSQLITLSGQEKLEVVYSNLSGESTFAGGVRARVWNESGEALADYSTERSTASSGTLTVDISALKGNYYVGAYANNSSGSYTGTCRVKSIKVLKGQGSSTGGTTDSSGTQIVLEVKEVTPTKEGFDVTPSPGMALSMVTVNPIPDYYQDVSSVTAHEDHVLDGYQIVDNTGALVDGNIPIRSSNDITANGATVTVPAGYYESAASKTVDGAGGSDISLEPIAVTPTKESQEFTPEDGKAYSLVTVEPIPDQYQDVSGVTAQAGHVLDGYYFVDSTGTPIKGEIPVVSDIVEFSNDDINIDRTDDISSITARFKTGQFISSGARVSLNLSNVRLGRATKADVADGVTFTSANGWLLMGEHVCAETGDVIVEPSDIEVDSLDNLHYWTKTATADYYEEEYYDSMTDITIGNVGSTVQYVDNGDDIAVSGDTITLVNPKEYTLPNIAADALAVLSGKYVQCQTAVCRFDSKSTINYAAAVSQYNIPARLNANHVYKLVPVSASESQTTIVVSQDSSAYPENGEQGNFNYVYQGTLSDTEKAAVIQSLTITSNGTYTAPSGVDGYSPVTVNVPTEGIDTSDATATENMLQKDYTAYANGVKLTGKVPASSETALTYISIAETEDAAVAVTGQQYGKIIFNNGGKATTPVPLTAFGDAEASDVVKGKFFTSTAGLMVEGTLETSSGGGSTLVTKTGTADSATIDTGLSEIVTIVLEASSKTTTGLYNASYTAPLSVVQFTSCSSKNSYTTSLYTLVNVTNPTQYLSVDGGIFTWTGSGTNGFISGVSYNWYALGYE